MISVSDLPHRVKIVAQTTSKGVSGAPKEVDAVSIDSIAETPAWVFELSGSDQTKPDEKVVLNSKVFFLPTVTITVRDHIVWGSRRYKVHEVRTPCEVDHHKIAMCRRLDR